MASNNSSTGGAGINPTAQKKNAPKGLFLALTLLKSGVDSQIPSKTSLLIGGQATTQSALSSELASDVALFQAAIDARTKLDAAVTARKVAVPTVKQRYAQIVKAIEGLFAPGSPVLAQFGIHPRKSPTPLTAEQKAVKAEKAKLTRKARGTLGRKQKQAIQTVGTPTVTITPKETIAVPQVVTDGPLPAGNSQPASPSSGTGSTQSGGSNAPSGK